MRMFKVGDSGRIHEYIAGGNSKFQMSYALSNLYMWALKKQPHVSNKFEQDGIFIYTKPLHYDGWFWIVMP